MRIAIISDGVHPYVVGGMQRHTYYLCKYLSLSGAKLTLYHFNDSKLDINKLEIFSDLERENIESVVIPFPHTNNLPGHYIRDSYKYSCLIYEHIKDRLNDFDFIYSKGFSAWKLIEQKSRKRIEFPPIGVKFHGYEMFQKQANFTSFLQSLILRQPVKWISNHADFVFSYGSKISKIIESLGVPVERIIEIPAGIEKDWISPIEKPQNEIRKFVYLGRYERRKGIEELNSVLNELIKEKLDFEFHFIGPFEKEQQIQSDLIHYHGSITDNFHIRRILDASDCLVCPSWSEGMPNVILEAMARSCAIIASDVGAVSIQVDSSNGLLIEPGNKIQLKKALINFLNLNTSDIVEMQKSSRIKIINKFEYSLIIEEVLTKISNKIK
jgi:glycosyltransferase involved in cell wall biosynthesis